MAFSADGNTVASAGADDQVILWDARFQSWMAAACQIADRNLTRQVWDRYVGSEHRYRRTCPDLPDGADA